MRRGAVYGRSGLGGYTEKQLAVVTPGAAAAATGMPMEQARCGRAA